MNNRLTVTIAGQEFTLLSDNDEQYILKIAEYIDGKVNEVMQGTRCSVVNAAVLSCVNIADDYFRALDSSENLRRQLKEYIEDSTKAKNELAEARREITRLKKQLSE